MNSNLKGEMKMSKIKLNWNEDLGKAPRDRRIMLVKRLNNEIVIQNLESLTNGAIQDQFVKWAELPNVY